MKRLSPCSGSRSALTLVEVVVAIVLLASLLVGMITAYGTHHRQIRKAARKREAVAAADQLLSTWYAGSQPKVPRSGQGLLRGQSDYLWRTAPLQRTTIELLPVEIIRLQVFPAQGLTDKTIPLAQVDLLIEADELNLRR